MCENKCHVKRYDGFICCGRQIVRGNNCIFHLENKNDNEAESFDKEFWKEFERMKNEGKEFDFTKFIFSNEINFRGQKFRKPVFFNEAKFNNIAHFSDTIFKHEAVFSNAEFNGIADFTQSIFSTYLFSWDNIPGNDNKKLIEFLIRKFGIYWVKTENIEKIDDRTIKLTNENNFLLLILNNEETKIDLKINDVRAYEFNVKIENDELNIYEKADFSEVKFRNIADFHKAKFNGIADFTQSIFGDKADFSEVKFNGKADFGWVEFDNVAYFSDVQFDNRADFYKSIFKGDVIFQSIIFKNDSFMAQS